MQKNLGKIKRTVEEYVVLTVATLILVVGVYVFKFPNNFFVWRSNRSGSRAGCRTSDISGKSYLYHQYAVAGTWIYIPWKRIWSQNCLRQCTDIGWVKLCGAGVSDGCASDRTAGIRAYLCDRTAGIFRGNSV